MHPILTCEKFAHTLGLDNREKVKLRGWGWQCASQTEVLERNLLVHYLSRIQVAAIITVSSCNIGMVAPTHAVETRPPVYYSDAKSVQANLPGGRTNTPQEAVSCLTSEGVGTQSPTWAFTF